MYRGRVLVDDEQGRWHAVVQLRRHGQRVEVEQVVLDVHPGHTLDVASWRGFPIAEVEATVNLPHYRRLIDEHWDSPDPPDDATLPIAVRKRPLRIGRYTPPPDGIRRYPDSHYQRVADTYTLHVEHGQPPAKRMSEDWGVPVSSINRWTKEARRRGLLAPARSRGRAG
jgi:hypothetical protein